ncbi:hypothetical protein ABL78_4686 [Leptomonas seymouri]|uniref:Uncharacterized protein n=1 Tax=Leptomonas seymouri TaxID=5684 RepID=A0A0N1I4K2_LEPSE|nr:hypothetical protein ABL78_4686 [Leptomonas seymouri]|eukprot:KPI86260.1 hypothetical protein ABL78_4686 [Leptomonas seymouri]
MPASQVRARCITGDGSARLRVYQSVAARPVEGGNRAWQGRVGLDHSLAGPLFPLARQMPRAEYLMQTEDPDLVPDVSYHIVQPFNMNLSEEKNKQRFVGDAPLDMSSELRHPLWPSRAVRPACVRGPVLGHP